MKYEILNAQGEVVNTVIATEEFMQAQYPDGNYREVVTPPPAPAIPQSVTRRQAKQALSISGFLDQVQPAIDAIADPLQRSLMQIEWDDSQEFLRDRPQLIQLATALGLTDEQIDELFILAATL